MKRSKQQKDEKLYEYKFLMMERKVNGFQTAIDKEH